MKKTIAIVMGIFALALVVVPVMAQGRPPGPPHHEEEPTTMVNTRVVVGNLSVSLANSGLNKQTGSGELRTGAAVSTSMNATQVNIGVLGCCESQEPSCCPMRGRGDHHQEESNRTNVDTGVMVGNASLALANSGMNSQSGSPVIQNPCRRTPPMRGGLLVTGRADAYSMNDTLVNVLVSGLN